MRSADNLLEQKKSHRLPEDVDLIIHKSTVKTWDKPIYPLKLLVDNTSIHFIGLGLLSHQEV